MPAIRVQIIRIVDDDGYPAFVECQLVDARGRTWSFFEKLPVVSADDLDRTSSFPQPGSIACEVIGRARDGSGREIVRVDTASPWGVESMEGETRFEIPPESLLEGE